MSVSKNLITKNLEIWTASIKQKSVAGRGLNKNIELYGIKKLRELILQLAVKGMLLEQNQNDESADKLFRKINSTRDSLIKSKRIKNYSFNLTNDSWSSIKIPKNWHLTTLGNIADWGSGSTPKRENPNYYKGSLTWLKSGELNDCQELKGSSEKITKEAVRDGSFRCNQIGDVLIAMYGATIGKVAILAEAAYTNQAVCGCTPFEGVFNRYLFYYLLSQRETFYAVSEGGAQPNISKIKLLGFPFPLPPLAEQYRIVSKVNKLMELCDQLEKRQVTNIDTQNTLVTVLLNNLSSATPDNSSFSEAWKLIQKNFDTLFSNENSLEKLKQTIQKLALMGKLVPQNSTDEPAKELLKRSAAAKKLLIKEKKIKEQKHIKKIDINATEFSLPNSWQWERLGNLVEMYNGRAFKSTEWANEGIPIVRIQNLNDKNASFNYFKGELSENHRIYNGSFLISWSGTPGTSFGAFIWKRGTAALNQHINKCSFFCNEINLEFMKLAVNGKLNHFISKAQGGVGLKHVTKGTLNNAILAIPPISEQHRIVAKVDELLALCDQLKVSISEAKNTQINLVDSLVEKAIR